MAVTYMRVRSSPRWCADLNRWAQPGEILEVPAGEEWRYSAHCDPVEPPEPPPDPTPPAPARSKKGPIVATRK